MEMFASSFFWVALAQIMMINIMLSGDNAVVIAMASRALPPKQQKHAIMLGSFGAIALRIILTFFAVFLLALPFLKIIGGVLLGWIGIQLLVPDTEEAELDGHSNLWGAVKTIIVADFVMSLDNVLGVAAAAKGNVPLLVIGLAVSIPLIVYGSTFLLKLMNRYPIIVTIGGGILGWVAGEMLVTDPAVGSWVDANAHWLHIAAPVGATAIVVLAGKWLASVAVRKSEHAAATARKGEHAAAAVVESGHVSAAAGKSEHVSSMGKTERSALAHTIVSEASETPPPGYHWVTRPWRVLPNGRREYAAVYGKSHFRTLEPVSSHLRPPRHH